MIYSLHSDKRTLTETYIATLQENSAQWFLQSITSVDGM